MIKKMQMLYFLNELSIELNSYLRKINYELILEKNFEQEKIKRKNSSYFYMQHADLKSYIFIDEYDLLRDPKLTLNRVYNILKIRFQIEEQIKNLRSKNELENNEVQETLNKLSSAVETGIINNTFFSSRFDKIHRSYRANRELGESIFASWWHSTLFQSRAESALYNVKNKLDAFYKKEFPEEKSKIKLSYG